jgi:acyl-CoA reductase-like NAD-dependent aldehyde dehydrogenase
MVAQAAADNLVPTTLELGGKSPALVHSDYPLERAGERIALGKLFNAGQTCIAPDYVLLPEGKEEAFAQAFRAGAAKAYPDLLRSEQYTSIVNDRHHARLQGLLEDAKAKGARLEVVAPGGGEPSGRRMAPVLVFGATPEMRLMQEELFGPILPVRSYRLLDEALAEIRSRPRPLAFYYFDEDERRATSVLRQVTSGGACLNDTLNHFAQEDLPFGGVGASGMGAYHGKAGFEAFSHLRGVLSASALSPVRQVQAPPYGKVLDSALNVLLDGARLLKRLTGR